MKRFIVTGLALIAVNLVLGLLLPRPFSLVFFRPFAGAMGAMLAVLIVLSVFLASRWRPVRVFVVHHHSDESKAALLRDTLRKQGVVAAMLPVRPRAHDEVISDVRRHFQECDVILVVPTNIDASFAKAEVLAAAVVVKPVVFVCDAATPLLDTAFQGYPRFDAGKLAQYHFAPLGRFLRFLTFHRGDVLPTIGRLLSADLESGVGYGCLVGFVVSAGALLLLTTFVPPPENPPELDMWNVAAVGQTILFAGAAAGGLFAMSRQRRKVRSAVRQQSITGTLSLSVLAHAFGDLQADEEILRCLEVPSPGEAGTEVVRDSA